MSEPETADAQNTRVVNGLLGFVASDGSRAFALQWRQYPGQPIDEIVVFLKASGAFIREAQKHFAPGPRLVPKIG